MKRYSSTMVWRLVPSTRSFHSLHQVQSTITTPHTAPQTAAGRLLRNKIRHQVLAMMRKTRASTCHRTQAGLLRRHPRGGRWKPTKDSTSKTYGRSSQANCAPRSQLSSVKRWTTRTPACAASAGAPPAIHCAHGAAAHHHVRNDHTDQPRP